MRRKKTANCIEMKAKIMGCWKLIKYFKWIITYNFKTLVKRATDLHLCIIL